MNTHFIRLYIILLVFCMFCSAKCFMANKLTNQIFEMINKGFRLDFGTVSPSFSHEVILKHGLHRSIVKYFYNKENKESPNKEHKIDMKKIDKEYLELKNIYSDYYGSSFCELGIDKARKAREELQINVEVVDKDLLTKDMPYAHFDAETFFESNQRVIEFLKSINQTFLKKDYKMARVLSGQILHTIQDFYSHSNWVEMGKTNINKEIGKSNFSSIPVINKTEKSACISNCTVITVNCSSFVKLFEKMMKLIGYNNLGNIKCPYKYYICSGNIQTLDKLVSGYYSDQKLEDGTEVNKPENLGKCSHGGILDKTQITPSEGGINKDSGFYLFSPHANLHLKAANLAIDHTEYFFNNIRDQIGDEEFSKFLQLELSSC